jgi:hypothetical protein
MTDDDDEMFTFSCGPDTFPFHSDCYTWPQIAAITADLESVILNVHCLRNDALREFTLLGIINMEREEQITHAMYLAKETGAQVIMFKGVGLTEAIIGTLIARMEEPMPQQFPGQKIAMLRGACPSKFQRRMMREAHDIGRRQGRFHEETLATRMKTSVEEIRWHLELLADLGLMERA